MTRPTSFSRKVVQSLRKIILGGALWYVLATGVPAVVNFAMTPILVRRFGIEGFAHWALLEPLILIGGAIATLGIQYGALNRVAVGRLTGGQAFAGAVALLMIVAPLAGILSLPVSIAYLGVGAALCLYAAQATEGLALISSNILRAERRPQLFAMTEGGRNLAVLAVTVACGFASLPWVTNSEQLLLTRSVVTLIAIGLLVGLKKLGATKTDRTSVADMFGYGWPIFFAQIFLLVASNADRYVIGLAGLHHADLTTYVVHNRLAGILNLALVSPLNLWYPVESMRRDTKTDGPFFEGILSIFIAFFLFMLIVMEILTPIFWHYLFPQVNLNLGLLVAAIGTVGLQGLAIIWNVGPLRTGHTRWNIAPPLISMIVMIVAGWALGQAYGLIGLAAARLLATGIYAVTFRAISQMIAPVRTRFVRLVPFVGATILIALVPTIANATARPLAIVAGLALTLVGLALNRHTILQALAPAR